MNPPDTSGGELGEFVGTITGKDWKKYGFIECELLRGAGYKDVFVLGDEIKNFEKGSKVRFTAYLTKDAKLQGKDLKPASVG